MESSSCYALETAALWRCYRPVVRRPRHVDIHHRHFDQPGHARSRPGQAHDRPFDPRAGYFGIEFKDYAAPIAAPVDVRYLSRHRLEKVDPTAARSRVKNPLVYYVDPGALDELSAWLS